MSINTQNRNGDWIPATPIGLCCEFKNCKNSNGLDYIRKGFNKIWNDEPIYLCLEHSEGYLPYYKQPLENKEN